MSDKCKQKGKDPETCSPEQIRECHGDLEHPCVKDETKCKQKGKDPKTCTPEQIKECHGTVDHSCDVEKDDKCDENKSN